MVVVGCGSLRVTFFSFFFVHFINAPQKIKKKPVFRSQIIHGKSQAAKPTKKTEQNIYGIKLHLKKYMKRKANKLCNIEIKINERGKPAPRSKE